MNPIIRRITENRLNDFKGLSIEGEIPISEEMVNEVLQLFLHQKKKPQKTGEPEASSSSGENSPDIGQILDSLDENDIKIEFKEKKAVLKVTVRKY
ncbi:MAG TPA: hypothetical protein VJ919_03710 [Tangfeifania sp.]|nr:hypothetical protein [Tangfeifania sp.]